jgi:hypothetical protein
MSSSAYSLTPARMSTYTAKANYLKAKADLGVYRCALAMRTVVPTIAIFPLLFGCCLRATSIVAVRTPDAIFMGSDSKMIKGDGSEAGNGCKILSSNEFFVGIARIWGSPAQGFTVASFAAEALNSNSDLPSRVTHFERLLLHPLERLLMALRTTDPSRFQRELEGQSAVDALFVGFEAGYPALLLRSFIVHNGASQSITARIRREDCSRYCSEALAYVALGQHKAIDKALAENPDLWKIGVAESIRKLINLEISAAPTFVGLPISILTIDKSGPRWIEQGACLGIGTR